MKVKIKKPYRYQIVGEVEFWEVELWVILSSILALELWCWYLFGDNGWLIRSLL